MSAPTQIIRSVQFHKDYDTALAGKSVTLTFSLLDSNTVMLHLYIDDWEAVIPVSADDLRQQIESLLYGIPSYTVTYKGCCSE